MPFVGIKERKRFYNPGFLIKRDNMKAVIICLMVLREKRPGSNAVL